MGRGVKQVVILDDHPLCREAIAAAISANVPDFEIVQVSSAREFGQLDANLSVVTIFVDLTLPDSIGLEAISLAQRKYPRARLCVISSRSDPSTVRQTIAAGVVGFIPKTMPFDGLSRMVGEVLEGRRSFPPSPTSDVETLGPLSPAEQKVMQAMTLGLLNKQIAAHLGLSESTIKSHCSRIFAKLNVGNRSQAILAFERASRSL